MTSPSIRDLAAQVAYLERVAGFVAAQISAVGGLARERVELDMYADNAVQAATSRNGIGMKEHLELAIKYGEEWFKAVNEQISRSNERGR